jgi:hypothetical protein
MSAAPVPRIVLPAGEPGDEALVALLREAQFLLLKHPIAAQAAFAALVAEGRRFAATPEGRAWHERLARAPLVRRGRVLWESSVLGLLEETPAGLLPTALLDAVVGAAARDDLPALLARLWPGTDDHDADPR